MKDEEDKDLDQLFKNRLQDSENLFAYNEEDWLALEAKLDKKDSRSVAIYWLRVGIGIAAMLVLCFGVWFVNKKTSPEKDTLANEKPKANTNALPTETAGTSTPKDNYKTEQAVQEKSSTASVNPTAQYQAYQPIFIPATTQEQIPPRTVTGLDSNKTSITTNDQARTIAMLDQGVAPNDSVKTNGETVAIAEPVVIANNQTKAEQPIVKKSKKQPINFAINVIAASDLNGINALKDSEVGTNIGVLFNVGVSKKLTVQTGLIYSDKPYEGTTDSYKVTYTSPYAAKYTPTSVYVKCKMFDIPLNLDYQIFENQSNKFSVGTGLSSYLMLHENYEYNFDPASNYASRNYEVPNSKSYLFSILNLSATYERKLTNSIGLTAQPYLKVPLRAVGYGDVKLQSVGFSLGLKMNFNKAFKKK